MRERVITEKLIETYRRRLADEEKRTQTIEKYVRDVRKLADFLAERQLTKHLMIAYKQHLEKCGLYCTSSINSFLAAANNMCETFGWSELKVKMIKVQRETFAPEEKELIQDEYERLVEAAHVAGKERLALIIQTLGSTGIRISELQFITVESLRCGSANVYNKGKARKVLFPETLRKVLLGYAVSKEIKCGKIFCTRSGKPLNRSNIWKELKNLCKNADVPESKVYPHNLRHLFARKFYTIKKDIVRLADVLGHSSIETTRIYVKTSGKEHKKLLDSMNMVMPGIRRKNRRWKCTVKSTT